MGRDAAADLAQDVLLLLHEKYRHVERLDELMPLSLQIARLKMLDHWRKTTRRGEHNTVPADDLPLAADAPDPIEQMDRARRLERLAQAMDRLGPRCRELFRLKLEGHPFADIRRRMGAATVNTVYTWDFRCRKELLALMGGTWE
jgi:RNA polymerase sigma-70 factor (ECF subfamily)